MTTSSCQDTDPLGGIGVWMGPGSFPMRWRDAIRKYSSRARHVKSMGLPASHIPVAYNYLVASILSYPAMCFDLDATTRRAEHIALAVVHSAPMFAFSPEIAVHMNLVGNRVACINVERMAWASKLRLVLSAGVLSNPRHPKPPTHNCAK